MRQAWAEQQRRGRRWTERYTKHARIELPDAAGRLPAASPSGMALDLLLLGAPRALRAGDTVDFQLLRDGQPLAGQALELHGEHGALGFWRRSDAEGRVRFTLPLAGRWVRARHGAALGRIGRRAVGQPLRDAGFRGRPGRRQNGSSFRLKARSASQAAASAAISAEPPAKTTIRYNQVRRSA